jgi:hypothetical protein
MLMHQPSSILVPALQKTTAPEGINYTLKSPAPPASIRPCPTPQNTQPRVMITAFKTVLINPAAQMLCLLVQPKQPPLPASSTYNIRPAATGAASNNPA